MMLMTMMVVVMMHLAKGGQGVGVMGAVWPRTRLACLAPSHAPPHPPTSTPTPHTPRARAPPTHAFRRHTLAPPAPSHPRHTLHTLACMLCINTDLSSVSWPLVRNMPHLRQRQLARACRVHLSECGLQQLPQLANVHAAEGLDAARLRHLADGLRAHRRAKHRCKSKTCDEIVSSTT